MNNKKVFSTRSIASMGIFSAIVLMLSLTPLGFIPIGGIVATTLHIPVIIAAIYYGPAIGSMVGLVFGVFSLLRAATAPTVLSFISLNPLCSVLPRVLIGFISGSLYKILKDKQKETLRKYLIIFYIFIIFVLIFSIFNRIKNEKSILLMAILALILIIFMVLTLLKTKDMNLSIVISAASGSLVNTFGFLSMAYLLYAKEYAEALSIDRSNVLSAIVSVGLINGAPELILAILISYSVIKTMLKAKRR
ncbi:MAG: ECF transporter S component [Tissierellia bacterium]|nr:ECF transporter S component [Tissierellia bacterium]